MIAWDAPGCGGSDDPPDDFTCEDYCDSLAGFLSSIGVSTATIAGLSWGGGLALEFYRRHPERVTALVLADTYAGWRGSLPAEVVAERLAGCLRESDMPAEEFVPGWIPGLVTEGASQELRDELVSVMSEFHPEGYRVMARAFAGLDSRDVLPNIRVPTLLIWGEHDQRSPLHIAEQFRNSIPNSELVVIPDAGHMSNMEQPDVFNTAVRVFCLTRVNPRQVTGRVVR